MCKFKEQPTPEMLEDIAKMMEQSEEHGGKMLGVYWTLGRYDVVCVHECVDLKTAMKGLIGFSKYMSTETLVAMPREEAMELVE